MRWFFTKVKVVFVLLLYFLGGLTAGLFPFFGTGIAGALMAYTFDATNTRWFEYVNDQAFWPAVAVLLGIMTASYFMFDGNWGKTILQIVVCLAFSIVIHVIFPKKEYSI